MGDILAALCKGLGGNTEGHRSSMEIIRSTVERTNSVAETRSSVNRTRRSGVGLEVVWKNLEVLGDD